MKAKLKKTIVCKEINNYNLNTDIIDTYLPKMGDVALFEIIEIGKHSTVQAESGKNEHIIEGDHLMAAFANRYATEQFEGYIPEQPTRILDILGAGGAIGIVKSKNAAFKYIEPTKLKLLGYAVDETGKVLNTINYKVKREKFVSIIPNNAKVILSIGSTMDSGKTTTAAYLSRGLREAGNKVAFIKLTGTSYTKDKDLVKDCGADVVLDFTDAGYPSTFMCDKEEIKDLYQTLLNILTSENPDYIVMEIADGILQRETEFLIRDKEFMKTISDVVFSAGDSLAAFFGISFLEKLEKKPVAIAGRFTMSPLLIQEVNERSNIPVLTLDDLMNPNVVNLFNSEKKSIALNNAH